MPVRAHFSQVEAIWPRPVLQVDLSRFRLLTFCERSVEAKTLVAKTRAMAEVKNFIAIAVRLGSNGVPG